MNDYRQNKRTLLVLFFLLLSFAGCLARLAWLQIIAGGELSVQAAENNKIMRELRSPRGSILDRDGRELAVSLISLSLFIDPAGMDDSRNLLRRGITRDPRKLAAELLAGPLNKQEKELYEIFRRQDTRFVWLERTMDKERSDRIEKIIAENELNGFGFLKESKRYYPMGKLAAQVLGFVGTDDFGLSGVEMSFDSLLKSAVETQFLETDIEGRPIFSSVLEKNKATSMASLYLTLDNRVQFAAEKALDSVMASTGAKNAAALVMDVQTGEILAMAARPTFDPNYFYNYSQNSWRNQAVATIYEPGSTFKPIVAAMAINDGVIQPHSLLNDFGRIKIDDREIKNSEDRVYGNVSFLTVITKSINTGMVEVGLSMGPARMNKYAATFGFGQYTGIDLPGEEEGLLFPTDKMRNIDVASMSIGQGIAVTPLQLLRAVGAIANGGKIVTPYIVEKIIRPGGDSVKTGGGGPERQVISKDTSEKVLAMMENVVREGGGTSAQIAGYRVAGKTGTAEKLKDGGGYAQGEYIASFVGVAPVEEPRFAALVLVDTPSHGYYGGEVAAPVFKEIMQQLLVIKGVEPSAAAPLPVAAPDKTTAGGSPAAKAVPTGYTAVPDITGLTIRAAARILEQSGLTLNPQGSGLAARQRPLAREPAKIGSEITVWFE